MWRSFFIFCLSILCFNFSAWATEFVALKSLCQNQRGLYRESRDWPVNRNRPLSGTCSINTYSASGMGGQNFARVMSPRRMEEFQLACPYPQRSFVTSASRAWPQQVPQGVNIHTASYVVFGCY